MRRSFKWALSLTPIVAGSVGTTVYFVSGNSVSNLGEIKTSRENVQIQSQFKPFSPSETNGLNQIPEKPIQKQEEKQAPKIQKAPIIIPEKLIKKTENPEKLKPTTIIISNKQEQIIPQVAPKPNKNQKILIKDKEFEGEKPKEVVNNQKSKPLKIQEKKQPDLSLLNKKTPEVIDPKVKKEENVAIVIPEKNKKEKNITKPKPPEPKILGNKLIKNKENTKISTAKTDIVIKKPEQNQEKYKEKLIKPPILPVLSAQPLVQKSPKVEKPLETPVNEKKN
ncbi:hypothetical protein [Mesomycoplasma hyopneumoniae]|uniref:hypothetical protein n=1 Tax=Mesomycoplasma hyopneumoniae TaxID=2099 RepID=UPI000B491E0F|nr:hypothetical protein [Mesomycoplasma hyopneumoniae]OWG14051.1 hypothetical protein B5C39_02775 [Mesomycoplasma hyopneumoniae]VEU65433.1 Uncharacterised protein [Mesomycoplasma hyopneumoniae]